MIIRLFLLCCALPFYLSAQDYPLPARGDSTARDVYFYELFTDYELRLKQHSAILGHYGWESPEHLKWRRETLEQDSLMRESVDAYIAREGFPVWVQPKPVRIASDTTGGAPVRYEYKKVPNPAYITFLILSTAPTFTERCGNLSLLEFEWERGSIGDANFHGYLESTHRSWKGEELEIATGTTERDRIRQYLLALDGCR